MWKIITRKLTPITFVITLFLPQILSGQVIQNIDDTCTAIDRTCNDNNPCTSDACRIFAAEIGPNTPGQCTFSCINPNGATIGVGTCSSEAEGCQLTPFECTTDADCSASDSVCNVSRCVNNSCTTEPIENCCRAFPDGTNPLTRAAALVEDCGTAVCTRCVAPLTFDFNRFLIDRPLSEIGTTTTAGEPTAGTCQAVTPCCGNRELEPPEECDPPNVSEGGQCDQNCQNTFEGQILVAPICGDDAVNRTEEQCDGTDLSGRTCQSEGLGNGTLQCNADCTLNTDQCGQCETAADCNDNNQCTNDFCISRVIIGGSGRFCSNPPVDPDDGDSCTNDSCDPATGVTNSPIENCPPQTCGNGVVEEVAGETCDFAAEGETPDTCDQNCKVVEPKVVASCRCDNSEDTVTSGACTEGGVPCCFPISTSGKATTFTCDLSVEGGIATAALTLEQKLQSFLSNSTVVWTQTSGTNPIRASGTSEASAEPGDTIIQSISVPAGLQETASAALNATTPIPVGNGKNFETYEVTAMRVTGNASTVLASAQIRSAIETKGGGSGLFGGCSLIR